MTGTVKNVSLDYLTDEVIVTLRVNGKSSAAALSDLIGVDADIEIKKHREKRSLDANAYLWVLIGKIADKLTIPKDEAYLNALKRYGQGGVVKVKDKYVDDLRRMFKYIEPLDELKEENAQYFRFWVGSSAYSTEEMSHLLDGVIADAKEIGGIETATPRELAMMKEAWQ